MQQIGNQLLVQYKQEGMSNASHNIAKNNKAGIAKSFLATHHVPKKRCFCAKMLLRVVYTKKNWCKLHVRQIVFWGPARSAHQGLVEV